MVDSASLCWKQSPIGLFAGRALRLFYGLACAAAGLWLISAGPDLGARLVVLVGGRGYLPPVDWGLLASVIGGIGSFASLLAAVRAGGALWIFSTRIRKPTRVHGMCRLVWTGEAEAWIEIDSGDSLRSFPVPNGHLDSFIRRFPGPANVECAWVALPRSFGGDTLIEISERSFAERSVA